MRKVVFLFLIILVLPIAYAATTEDTPKVIDTKFNVSIKGYMDGNVSKVNLTIFTEDEILNYNSLSSSSNIFEIHEINVIRTLKCPLSNVEDLQSTIKTYFETQECGEKSCATMWAECKTAKTRLEETKNTQDATIASLTTQGNYNITQCVVDKNALSVQYNDVTTKNAELEQTKKDDSSNRWIIAIVCLVAGAGGYYFLGDTLRKDNAKAPPHEKNYGQLRDSQLPSSRIDEIYGKTKGFFRGEDAPKTPRPEMKEAPIIPFQKEVKKKETKEEVAQRIMKELSELDDGS